MVDIAAPVAAKPASRFRFILDRREVLGSVLVAPAVLYVLLLVGLPFLLAVYYSVSAYSIYNPSWRFVGLANFEQIVRNPEFLHTLGNTFLFTFGSQALGLVLGKFGAFLLLRPFPGRRIVRALIILPWAVPIALSTVAWQWMFNSLYSVINWSLIALGILTREDAPNWLGTPHLAMLCIIVVNAWRFFPFAIVIFLAGITSVPQDVIDAAIVDGAGFWRRNYQIIMPMILPIVAIGLIFGIVFTFTDLSIVLLLTNGGPVGTTSVLGFEGYQVGIVSGDVSHGAAISLFMLPVLFVVVIGMLRFITAQGDLDEGSLQGRGQRRLLRHRRVFRRHDDVPVLLDGHHLAEEQQRSLQRHEHSVLVQRGADAGALRISVPADAVHALAVEFLVIGLCVTAITLVTAVPAGYSLARMSGRNAETLGIGIFLTYLVPPTLLFLPLSRIVAELGLQNSMWSLVLVYPTFTIPFCTWLLMGFFKAIPPEIEEAAIVDGCSLFGAFIKMVIPLSVPAILTVIIFTSPSLCRNSSTR